MTPDEVATEVERLRVEYNANVGKLGVKELSPEKWHNLISTPLYDPHMELVRQEDKRYPGRICQWCFHPRNSAECNFAQGHTPYREMFA